MRLVPSLALLLLAAPLRAQGDSYVGIHVQAGVPFGSLEKDLNGHVGYGSALSWAFPVAPRVMLRPNVEYNGYRVSPYDMVAWATNTDDKEIFRTYKAGVDLLFYLQPGCERGMYVLGGIGGQHSRVDWTLDGADDRVTADTRLVHNGAWYGLGVGFQVDRHVAFEFRYSRAPYAAERSLPMSSLRLTERITRDGDIFHATVVFRLPAR